MGATFMNPDLITDIKKSEDTLVMNTNSGQKIINQQGEVPGFGMAWFDENQMANIFGFATMADKHQVTYNSEVEDAFNV